MEAFDYQVATYSKLVEIHELGAQGQFSANNWKELELRWEGLSPFPFSFTTFQKPSFWIVPLLSLHKHIQQGSWGAPNHSCLIL